MGRITRAHGVRGEASVQPLTELDRFVPGAVLNLEDGRTLTVESVRPHSDRLLVKFREAADREEVDLLRGEVLLAEPTGEGPAEGWWIHQVVGLEVVTEDGRPLGRISDVVPNPANDLWVVAGRDGEVMVPAVTEVIVEVDLEDGRAVIRDVPGLIDGEG